MGANGLNLWEHSDKRRFTSFQDSVNEDGTEFAIFNFHVSSVGITLGTVIVIIIVIALVRNVRMSCLKSMYRRVCNCKDYGQQTDNNQQSNPIIISPHAYRTPIVPNSSSNQMYPDLQPFSYRFMAEAKPGMPEQYHPTNLPTAPVTKPAEGASVNIETTNTAPVQDDISKKKSFQDLQLEAYNKIMQQRM